MRLISATAVSLLLAAGTLTAGATTTIDFETQAVAAPDSFDGNLNSPLTIGNATFVGGELLNNLAAGVDQSGVYATTNLVAGDYMNPITINFSSPVSNFSVLVTDNAADTFTVADDLGDSVSMFLDANSMQTFSLPGSGLTAVTISEGPDSGIVDFAIDDVMFSGPTPVAATPEPASMMLMGTGLLGMAGTLRRRLA